MSNFALTTNDPYGDVISSVNYLLATQGQGTANIGNVLVANATTGQITTANDPNYLAYLYQYIDVRYADSADGSVNFSTSPTNRLYFGVRNYQTGGGSSNPADYIWTQVAGGGFSTNRFLYYQTNGGRQVQFAVATSPPGSSWAIVPDAVAIDLDILSSLIASQTAILIYYTEGQVFNKDGSNVWTPNIVSDIVTTTANVTVVRSNSIVAQIVKSLNYNTSADTWTISNVGPDINANSFTFANAIIESSAGYYQTFTYNDVYANLAGSYQIIIVSSGIDGVNGIDASTISVVYDNTQLFTRDAFLTWTPNVNANGVIQTNVTVSVSQANTVIGQATRTINYNTEYNNVVITGGSTTMSNIGVVEKDGYTYFCYYNTSDNGNLVVTGGNIQADILLVGGGYPGTISTAGGSAYGTVYTMVIGGEGGEVIHYPNVTLTPNTYPVFLSTNDATTAGNGITRFGNGNIIIARGGRGTGSPATGFGNRATPGIGWPSNAPDGSTHSSYTETLTNVNIWYQGNTTVGNGNVWFGGNGSPDPWGTIDWILEPPYDNNPAHEYTASGSLTNLWGYQRIYDANGLAWFGGGGGSNQSDLQSNIGILGPPYGSYPAANVTVGGPYPQGSPGYGGLGGGGSGGGNLWPNQTLGNSSNFYTSPGIYGGGGSGQTTLGTVVSNPTGSSGLAIIRVATADLKQWFLDGDGNTDIDGNNFTFTNAITSSSSYTQNVIYSNTAANSLIGATLSVAVVTAGETGNIGPQGSRGFIPLAYVVTTSDPTLLSNSALSSAFAAPRDNPVAPIGTGYVPITGDTAQFIYIPTGVSVVKTYDDVTGGWSDADGEVIDGNVIVTGTITANKLNANDVYALTVQSTSATVGSNTSPGFWLQAGTGNARFGGGLNIGDSLIVGNTAIIGTDANIGSNLTVGNNAVIGGNLNVSGLITTGNLIANTVATTTIVPNAVTNSNGVSISGTVYTNNSVTLSNLGLIQEGSSFWFQYESPQFFVENSGVNLTFQDTQVVVGVSGQTQVQGNVYVDQDFSPYVTSQLYRKDPTGSFTAVAPKNFSSISTVFAGNQSVAASQVINDFYSYTVGTIESFSTNGVSQIHTYGWAYSLGALVAGYEATANGNIRGTNPTVSVTQFKR